MEAQDRNIGSNDAMPLLSSHRGPRQEHRQQRRDAIAIFACRPKTGTSAATTRCHCYLRIEAQDRSIGSNDAMPLPSSHGGPRQEHRQQRRDAIAIFAWRPKTGTSAATTRCHFILPVVGLLAGTVLAGARVIAFGRGEARCFSVASPVAYRNPHPSQNRC